MNTPIDLPEQLLNEVATLAARERRNVAEVVAELVRAGLESRTHPNRRGTAATLCRTMAGRMATVGRRDIA